MVQPTLQLASLESKITDFMTQQTLFNNHSSDILNRQSNQIKEIQNIAQSVSDQQVRIAKLEKQNASLSESVSDVIEQKKSLCLEVTEVKNSLTNVIARPSPRLIISGLPNQSKLEPHVVLERTLAELDPPQLVNDILDIRQVMKNENNSQPMILQTNSSYIIKLESEHVAHHIITLKRRKGLLNIGQVFNRTSPDNFYINKFLTSATHLLYRKIKEVAKEHHWKYVWIKEGMIAARKNDSTNLILIHNESDLQQIHSD